MKEARSCWSCDKKVCCIFFREINDAVNIGLRSQVLRVDSSDECPGGFKDIFKSVARCCVEYSARDWSE